jgi:hypothetical protein
MSKHDEGNWDDLVAWEPRILSLRRHAATADASSPTFCANRAWSGRSGMRRQLYDLVGWSRTTALSDLWAERWLHTSEAWDLAYHGVYDALPGCRRCGCIWND